MNTDIYHHIKIMNINVCHDKQLERLKHKN